MADIADVPMPQILDPDRLQSHDRDDMTMTEHRSRAQQLDMALHESCDYAQQLWRTLGATRQYLMDTIPSDPTTGHIERVSASPTGFDDEEGWERWIDVYGTVTSSLCGPHGDSGFGRMEAQEAAQRRRARAALLPTDELSHLPSHREGEGTRVAETFVRARAERLGAEPEPGTPSDEAAGSSPARSVGDRISARRSAGLRIALEAGLFVLALRGLRRRGI